jgi:hypothetical protein
LQWSKRARVKALTQNAHPAGLLYEIPGWQFVSLTDYIGIELFQLISSAEKAAILHQDDLSKMLRRG